MSSREERQRDLNLEEDARRDSLGRRRRAHHGTAPETHPDGRHERRVEELDHRRRGTPAGGASPSRLGAALVRFMGSQSRRPRRRHRCAQPPSSAWFTSAPIIPRPSAGTIGRRWNRHGSTKAALRRSHAPPVADVALYLDPPYYVNDAVRQVPGWRYRRTCRPRSRIVRGLDVSARPPVLPVETRPSMRRFGAGGHGCLDHTGVPLF